MKKSILITGASSGIGRATAEYFAKKGWNVIATMRHPEKEQSLQNNDSTLILALDVQDQASIEQAINTSMEKFGQIDVLVNNAGYAVVGPFEAISEEQARQQFETNVFGLMNVTRAILPHFRKAKSGTVINISSVGGRATFPLYSLYHATKWAVDGFSESLHFELKRLNIKIRIVEPGPIKTDFYTRSMDIARKDGLTAYDSFAEKTIQKMNKFGDSGASAESVAKTIYKAATSNSGRLRYSIGGGAGGMLFMRRILPDSWFNFLIEKNTMD